MLYLRTTMNFGMLYAKDVQMSRGGADCQFILSSKTCVFFYALAEGAILHWVFGSLNYLICDTVFCGISSG